MADDRKQEVEGRTQSFALWAAVIGLLAALVGLVTAYVQYEDKKSEVQARLEAERGRGEAEKRAQDEAGRRKALEAEKDSIHKFFERYREDLQRIRQAQENLAAAKRSESSEPKSVPNAEAELRESVLAFSKFLDDWRTVHHELDSLLDGDAREMDAAAREGRFADVERRLHILEKNSLDKKATLEELIRRLNAT